MGVQSDPNSCQLVHYSLCIYDDIILWEVVLQNSSFYTHVTFYCINDSKIKYVY